MNKIINIMRKIPILVLSFILVFTVVFAQETNTEPTSSIASSTSETTIETGDNLNYTNTIPPLTKGIDPEDLKQFLSIQEKNGWRLGQIGNYDKENTLISIKGGIVRAILDDNKIEVSIFDIPFTVDLTNSKLYRQIWSNSEINEISTGDVVNIYGYLEDDNKTIDAITLRDLSITPLETVIKGTITSLNSDNNSFTVQTSDNLITVNTNENTNIIRYIGNDKIQYVQGIVSDLKTGELVIIRGIYNANLKSIDAKVIMIGNDGHPFFKVNVIPQNRGVKNQIQEIKNLINQIKEQFRIRFK